MRATVRDKGPWHACPAATVVDGASVHVMVSVTLLLTHVEMNSLLLLHRRRSHGNRIRRPLRVVDGGEGSSTAVGAARTGARGLDVRDVKADAAGHIGGVEIGLRQWSATIASAGAVNGRLPVAVDGRYGRIEGHAICGTSIADDAAICRGGWLWVLLMHRIIIVSTVSTTLLLLLLSFVSSGIKSEGMVGVAAEVGRPGMLRIVPSSIRRVRRLLVLIVVSRR